MQWQQVCEDPSLQNLPYKIELNQQGQIIMSPASINHIFYQSKISTLLKNKLTHGEVASEFPVETTDGLKVVDVAWVSDELFQSIKGNISSSTAPSICIEVLSNSNTHKEMMHKKQLYFDTGALEFWLCYQDGQINFYDKTGQIPHSNIVKDFPMQVII